MQKGRLLGFGGAVLCVLRHCHAAPEFLADSQPNATLGLSPREQGTRLKRRLYVVYTRTTVNPWSEACNTCADYI